MAKITYHIPTEQFGFVEVENEHEEGVEVESYESVKAFFVPPTSPEEGLDQKEWNTALDGYLTLNTMPSEVYERMSLKQKGLIQEIKKSIKRLAPEKEDRIRPELTQ